VGFFCDHRLGKRTTGAGHGTHVMAWSALAAGQHIPYGLQRDSRAPCIQVCVSETCSPATKRRPSGATRCRCKAVGWPGMNQANAPPAPAIGTQFNSRCGGGCPLRELTDGRAQVSHDLAGACGVRQRCYSACCLAPRIGRQARTPAAAEMRGSLLVALSDG